MTTDTLENVSWERAFRKCTELTFFIQKCLYSYWRSENEFLTIWLLQTAENHAALVGELLKILADGDETKKNILTTPYTNFPTMRSCYLDAFSLFMGHCDSYYNKVNIIKRVLLNLGVIEKLLKNIISSWGFISLSLLLMYR